MLSFFMRTRDPSILPDGVGLISYPFLRSLRRFPILGAPVVNSIPHAMLLKRTVEKLHPQIVIANEATSYGLYAALAGIGDYCLFVWGSDVLIAPQRSVFLRMIVKFALKRATRILVDSTVQRDACIDLGASGEKILIVPWYDYRETAEATIGERERVDVRRALGIAESAKVVVSSRWHRKPYSVETLIESVPLVLRRVPSAKFLVMGSGPDTSLLKNAASRLGVGGSIIFTGKLSRPDVLRYTQVADAYVSTSLSDGTSASLLDAMTLGIPVIVTDIPANREWVVPGSSGLLFPPRDHEELAKQICVVLGDEGLSRSLADSALATVTARADWRANSRALEETLDGLASSDRSRAGSTSTTTTAAKTGS